MSSEYLRRQMMLRQRRKEATRIWILGILIGIGIFFFADWAFGQDPARVWELHSLRSGLPFPPETQREVNELTRPNDRYNNPDLGFAMRLRAIRERLHREDIRSMKRVYEIHRDSLRRRQ